MAVIDDLEAEQDRLEAILDGLDDAQMLAASAAPGWTVADVVLHLAQSEEAVVASAAGLRVGIRPEPGMTVDQIVHDLVHRAAGRRAGPEAGARGAGDHRLLALREVQHHVGDRPAGCRRRRRPLRAVEAAEDLLQPILLRLEVVKDGHAWTMPPRPRLRPGRGQEIRAFARSCGTGLTAIL